MPVEIRELTIKVHVDEQAAGNTGSSNAGGSASGGDSSAIVKEAVEEVMRVLESKKER